MQMSFITISLKAEPAVIESLDQMVREEDSDRSKFIRKLIREEKIRRNGHKPADPCGEEEEKKP
jgi:metal-responsive CopG/Arc/MetJ family transcriptional regulator